MKFLRILQNIATYIASCVVAFRFLVGDRPGNEAGGILSIIVAVPLYRLVQGQLRRFDSA